MILFSWLCVAQRAPPEKRRARMNMFTGVSQLACVIVSLLGCVTGPQLHTHPLGRPHVRIDHFGAGEVPAATISGCGGETVSWHVVNLANGQQVLNGTAYVPHNHWWTVQFPGLAAGSYNVTFTLHGSGVAGANFSVTY